MKAEFLCHPLLKVFTRRMHLYRNEAKEKELKILELESQMFLSCTPWVLGNKLGVYARAVCTPNLRTISLGTEPSHMMTSEVQ